MGLAGRKHKQRIPADPRNLSWADDASRFGLSYLSKFGWDASQGLGSSGDGVKTHLKVQQKLDMMGVGAQHQRDPNGIAWKQNKDFEALLKRLNESAGEPKRADGEDEGVRETALGSAFVRAQEDESATKQKRKREDVDDPEKTRNKRKKEKRENSWPPAPAIDPTSASKLSLTHSSSEPPPEPTPKPRPMAHRARIRAAKRIAGKSASAIAEILGIASSSASPSSTPAPAPLSPSQLTSTPAPHALSLDNLTTSTKSVADYFKEKLLVRSSSSPASSTPGLGAPESSPPDDDEELPRRGIGSRAPAVSHSLIPFRSSEPVHDPLDARDASLEKQRRKAERKAERRRRREGEVGRATPEGVEAQMQQGADETRETSDMARKEDKEAPVDGSNGVDATRATEKSKKKPKERHEKRRR